MYSYIEGKLVEKNPAYVICDCGGIGYMIHISINTYTRLKAHDTYRLYTHLAIKNEATTPVGFSLYGFAEEKERTLFRKLISVSGIGFNTALLVLSSLTPETLYRAIHDNNPSLLQSVKGIGPKSAQRIIIDLRDKIDKPEPGTEFAPPEHNTIKQEALSGLSVLGFSKPAAEKALDRVISKYGQPLKVEDLIKEALKIL
ncbi:MAG: Holliday junction branch migration protein RuvA [Bacteroidales bacterium]|nr:Holliday junction branch migration protein RuvA [Bacteroidales bacterium]